jgi:hypothetical protein
MYSEKLVDIAKLIVLTAGANVSDKVKARAIGTMIYDIPTKRSGLVSTALLDKYGYRPAITKCTQEHFHSRNETGVAIIEMVARNAAFESILDHLSESVMVHLTTKEENIRLSAIQNHPVTKDLTWQEQYDLAGIELVEDPGTMPAKMRQELQKM